MKKYFFRTGVCYALLLLCIHARAQQFSIKKQMAGAATQMQYMLAVIDSARAKGLSKNQVSPRTLENDTLKMVRGQDWTSGFFPGALWYMYEYTGNEKWKQQAQAYTRSLQPVQYYGGTHDLGFIMYCSFGNGYRLTKDTACRSVIIQSAKTLATRFNPVAGVIKSWDFASASKWQYPVIIDNMMNLELLFEATKLSGDSSFYKIAISHADKTMINHYRSNYSSYHVIDYDPVNGTVRQKITAQGYSDSSSWARGQAWGLYGFTMCYRETHNKKYLEQAKHIAAYIISRLPADKVPYWDYDAPGIPNEPKDASAACVTASALYELYTFTKNKQYRTIADQLMQELCKHYVSPLYMNKGFILLHSTGHKPANSEVDVPLSYADYYFIEALLRRKNL
ncbi:MAG: glycoside hydrolase family 88 protein [Bacteroidetes bacterium]|nr:glycoside hydrolase family 88 protein [Bacteroidota bacterium]